MKNLSKTLVLAAAMATPVAVNAQDGAAPAAGSALSVEGSISMTNQYLYHGIAQENQGIIIQGHLQLNADLGEIVPGLTANAGIWNSFHENGAGAAAGNWYEADLYIGAAMAVPGVEGLEASLTFTNLHSPNGAFGTVQELAIGASYDDSGMWGEGGIQLNPSASLVLELDGQSDGGAKEGVRLVLGIEPGFENVLNSETTQIDITVPVNLGLDITNYYEDAAGDHDFFGYLTVGVNTSVPLDVVPASLGNWSLDLGVTAWFLGDNVQSINAAGPIGSSSDVEVVGTIGVSFSQ